MVDGFQGWAGTGSTFLTSEMNGVEWLFECWMAFKVERGQESAASRSGDIVFPPLPPAAASSSSVSAKSADALPTC